MANTRAGAYFWNGAGPDEFAQMFSLAAESMDGKAEDVVLAVVVKAVERMEEIVVEKDRIDTGKMFDSIDGKVTETSNGRVRGQFGFDDSKTPLYTRFQERGTRRGITPMLAYATAQAEAITELQDLVDSTNWVATSDSGLPSKYKRKRQNGSLVR